MNRRLSTYFRRHYRVLVLALALSAPVSAVVEVTGTTPGGAAYRIAVPDGWETGDPLVLVQHEYTHERDTDPDLGPLRETQLAEGMAIAASGYRQGGWALFRAFDDNAELLETFTARFGEPGNVYATGERMGGLVALKLAEDPRFRNVVKGVAAICPLGDGVLHWDQSFDLRLIYDNTCSGVAGAALPVGDAPFPWAMNLGTATPPALSFDAGDPALLAPLPQIGRCTGLDVAPAARTVEQSTRLARIKNAMKVEDEHALIARFAYATYGLSDLVRGTDKLANRSPFLNQVERLVSGTWRVRYDPSDLNNTIVRVPQTDAMARFDLERSSLMDGQGIAKLSVARTSLDELSFASIRIIYPPYDVATWWESAPANCSLAPAEREAAFRVATTGESSNALAHSTACQSAMAAGTPGPCRSARPPGASLAFTDTQPERYEYNMPTFHLGDGPLTSSGFWFDPLRDGEGIVIEELATAIGTAAEASVGGVDLPVFLALHRRVLVSWYTFAPPGDPNPGPRWLNGIGFQTGQGVHVPSMTITRGARFGADFDPADVERIDWGSLSLTVDARGRMRVRYDGPPGWEGSERQLEQFARTAFESDEYPCCILQLISPPPPVPPPSMLSANGSYFNPARDGEGIQFQVVQGPANAPLRGAVVFYTYDTRGNQLWLIGSGDVPAQGGEFTFDVIRTEGAVFGDTFDPADVDKVPWGTITMTAGPQPSPGDPSRTRYNLTSLRWTPIEAGYVSGSVALIRLTKVHVSATFW